MVHSKVMFEISWAVKSSCATNLLWICKPVTLAGNDERITRLSLSGKYLMYPFVLFISLHKLSRASLELNLNSTPFTFLSFKINLGQLYREWFFRWWYRPHVFVNFLVVLTDLSCDNYETKATSFDITVDLVCLLFLWYTNFLTWFQTFV